MGQRITEDMRRKMLRRRHVREVTAEHVILNDGTVLDPKEFIAVERPARFILKLLDCRCWLIKHPAGLHVLVGGNIRMYGDGRERIAWNEPDICRRGHWTCEETLPAVAVRFVR